MDRYDGLEEQYEKIYRYCYFKVHSKELAEDITQEAFLRLFEKRGKMVFEMNVQYLYTIARNLCIDEYRRQRDESLDEEAIESKSFSHEDDILTQICVREALDNLSEPDRELILLRFVNGVPVSAISKITGKSRFAVRRDLQRIKKILSEKLGEEGVH